jgi:hypothetical protein
VSLPGGDLPGGVTERLPGGQHGGRCVVVVRAAVKIVRWRRPSRRRRATICGIIAVSSAGSLRTEVFDCIEVFYNRRNKTLGRSRPRSSRAELSARTGQVSPLRGSRLPTR